MIEKTNRGGEGRNTRSRSDRSGPAPAKRQDERAHGIVQTSRGEDQPADKARAKGPQERAGIERREGAARGCRAAGPVAPGSRPATSKTAA